MFELSKMELIGAYLCELNSNMDAPLISNYDVEQDDDITITFIENTIYNLYSSKDMKWARFIEDEEQCSKAYKDILQLSENLSDFKIKSKNIIYEYFKIITDNVPVPSGDLIIVLFEMEKQPYLGIFKYNHKTMLVSQVDKLNDTNNIYISQKSSLFTTNKHKADEGFIINLISFDIALVDKKYEINAEKSNILQDNILLLQTSRSEKEKLDIFNKVTKNLEDKYIGDDIEKKAKIKKAVKDTVLDEGVISVDSVMQKAFEETEQLKKIYENTLEKSGIQRREKIEVPERLLKTKFQRQKITTETGIEINVPIDYYGDDSKIEFVPDDNGTISIVIKNVKNITT
ncbi:MAG: nucleoid-associated protein [Peptoanaerobacter stomatis]